MLQVLAKKRMRNLQRIAIDDKVKQAHSVHSIALEDLRNTLIVTETQCSELIANIKVDTNNKGY